MTMDDSLRTVARDLSVRLVETLIRDHTRFWVRPRMHVPERLKPEGCSVMEHGAWEQFHDLCAVARGEAPPSGKTPEQTVKDGEKEANVAWKGAS